MLLEPEQLEALRQIEAETGAPVARQIRMAIEAWISSRRGKSERKRAATRKRS